MCLRHVCAVSIALWVVADKKSIVSISCVRARMCSWWQLAPRLLIQPTCCWRRSGAVAQCACCFCSSVRDPMLKDPTYNPTELVSLIAAEEAAQTRLCSLSTCQQIYHHVSSNWSPLLRQRLQRQVLGSHVGRCVASAVASAMFGNGSPDDASEAGFSGPSASIHSLCLKRTSRNTTIPKTSSSIAFWSAGRECRSPCRLSPRTRAAS